MLSVAVKAFHSVFTTSCHRPRVGGRVADHGLNPTDERRRIMSLLQNLPAEYREPLMLRYLGGADYETIGRQLAISNGSLRGLLQRGMKLLRDKMREKES